MLKPQRLTDPASSLRLSLIAVSLAGALIWADTQESFAQLPQIKLYSLFPAGGQKGTTVELALTNGADLDEASQLIFSHPGIKAAQKTAMVDGNPQPVANQFTVTIDPNTPPGSYDVRAVGLFGVSNPRTFVVGDRKEAAEVEPNNTVEQATPVEINTVINGKTQVAADLDFYKISLKQGQRVLIDCASQRLDSKMDAKLLIYSPAGKLLVAHAERFHNDPLVDFTAPADGDYLLRVQDSLFQGDPNNYGYRLSVHTGPHIDFVFPPAGLAGTNAEFTLYGRNLPGGTPSTVKVGGKQLEQLKVSIAMPATPTIQVPAENLKPAEAPGDGISYTLASPAGTSNPVMVYFAAGKLVPEMEPNDTPDKAQVVTVPCDVVGQFQAVKDIDFFTFEAKAGDVFWLDVYGQRNGSGADPYLTVDQVTVNEKGVETVGRITAQDDNVTLLIPLGFDSRSDDPSFRFAAPANSKYRVSVRDRYFETRGDPRLVYRLSIRPEQLDYRLLVLPLVGGAPPALAATTDITLRKGDNVPVEVLAFRLDGYAGVIDVNAEGLPEGVTCAGASIGPGQNAATLIFSSTEQVAPWTGSIRVVGKARMDDANAVKAVTDTENAAKAAVAAIPALDKAVTDTAAAAKAAADKAAAAKAASDLKTDDKELAKAKEETAKAAVAAATVAKTAADAKAAGDKQVADTAAAVTAAQAARVAAVKEVVREARSGTIVWSQDANGPAKSRVARSIALAVNKEVAPFQLVAGVGKVDVNQSGQILVPLKLLKRAGFDDNVPLTFVGQPANVQIENKPIPKGKDAELVRIFVPTNAVPGSYTMYLKSTAPVSYSRNPEAAAAALKEKEALDKTFAEVTEVAKKATEAKTAADKKGTDSVAEAKKATDAKTAADKLATDTATVATAAAAEKVKADKAAEDAAAAAKAAVDKAAEAKAAADKDATNKTLADAKTAADKVVVDTAAVAKTAADAKAVADKKALDTAAESKKAADAKVITDKAAVDTAALAKTAEEERVKADKANTEAAEKLKAVTAAKAVADKKATDTATASKPANLNFTPPSTPIVITIKLGPGTLAAAVPNGGALKQGDKAEVKVTVTRANGFAGPLELSLPLPPNVAGLTAAPVVIPADKNEGVLVIQAAADATEGALANLVVRGSMEFNGKAAVDQPIAITVTK